MSTLYPVSAYILGALMESDVRREIWPGEGVLEIVK